MTPLIARFRVWLDSIHAHDPAVADAAIMGNLRRLRWLLPIVIALNLAHVGVFWIAVSGGTPVQMSWKNAIGWAHLCMAVWLLLPWLAARQLSQQTPPGAKARLLQIVVPLGFVFFTTALTVIGQSVTPNISPFLLGSVFVSLLLLMQPSLAVGVFGFAYALFYVGLGFTQHDPLQLLTNRASGLAAMKRCSVAARSAAASRSAFIMPVSPTGPGQTALTRMRSFAWHRARLFVRPISAILLIE